MPSISWDSFIGAGIQQGFVNSTTDNGGTINSSKVTGPRKNLRFSNRDILNKPGKICLRTKVHFEVRKRGGRCVAVKINVIDVPEETVCCWILCMRSHRQKITEVDVP